MQLHERPVWSEGAHYPVATPALPQRADVAIIGGGITGLAAALGLARAGASVAVLEAQHFGWGAGARNGGMVLSGLKLDASTLLRKYGPQRARRLFDASLAAIDTVEHLVTEESIDCDFARTGHLVLASKPAHARALADEATLLLREFGHATSVVAPSDLAGEVGSRAFFGGLVDERSAGIDPARYLAGLANAALRRGACLLERAAVERVVRNGRRWRVETTRGTLDAGAVFVATAGYTGRATPALRRKVLPVGSYVIATVPLPETLAREISPRERMMFDTKHFLHYFRLTPDRRMLFGGRARFVPETPGSVRESAVILRREMLEFFPQLADTPTAYAWGGTLDFTFDLMPHAGEVDGMHVAVGYAGHGVALATYLGTRVATRLTGGPADNPFAELPLPAAPLGLYRGNPWFLPLAGAWYKMRDWVS